MIHTVYFWLDPLTEDADHQSFIEGCKSLAKAPTVQRFTSGKPAGTKERDVTDHSFDYSIQLTFASVADHDAYQSSDVHLKFVDEHSHKFAVVKVFDSES